MGQQRVSLMLNKRYASSVCWLHFISALYTQRYENNNKINQSHGSSAYKERSTLWDQKGVFRLRNRNGSHFRDVNLFLEYVLLLPWQRLVAQIYISKSVPCFVPCFVPHYGTLWYKYTLVKCAMSCATLWHIEAQIYISKVCHVFCHVLCQTHVIGVNGVNGVNGVIVVKRGN